MAEFKDKLDYIMKLQGYNNNIDIVNEANKIARINNLTTTISKQNISNYLLGNSVPNTDKLRLLAMVFHVDPSYFLLDDISPISDNMSDEENRLVNCWRLASDHDKAVVAMMLAPYGFYLNPKKLDENAV